MFTWDDVEQSPEYKALPGQQQFEAKKAYFQEVIEADPEYAGFTDSKRAEVKKQFFGGNITLTPSFGERVARKWESVLPLTDTQRQTIAEERKTTVPRQRLEDAKSLQQYNEFGVRHPYVRAFAEAPLSLAKGAVTGLDYGADVATRGLARFFDKGVSPAEELPATDELGEKIGRGAGQGVAPLAVALPVSAATGGMGFAPIIASLMAGGAMGAVEASGRNEDVLSGALQGAAGMGVLHGAGRAAATISPRLLGNLIKSGELSVKDAERIGSMVAGGVVGAAPGMKSGDVELATEGLVTGAGYGGLMPFNRFKRRTKLQRGISTEVIAEKIRPFLKDYAYGKEPDAIIGRRGIFAWNWQHLKEQVNTHINNVGRAIGKVVDRGQQRGVRVNSLDLLKLVDQHMENAVQRGTEGQKDVERLQNLRNIILYRRHSIDSSGKIVPDTSTARDLKNLSAKDAFELKQILGDPELAKWRNDGTDKSLILAIRDIWGRHRDNMNDAMPELRPLNKDYGDLLSARQAIDRRSLVEKRNMKIGLLETIAAVAGLHHRGWGEAAGLVLLSKALKSMPVRTAIAKLLASRKPADLKILQEESPEVVAEIVDAMPSMRPLFATAGRVGITPSEKASAETVNPPEKPRLPYAGRPPMRVVEPGELEPKKYPIVQVSGKVQGEGFVVDLDTGKVIKAPPVAGAELRPDYGEGVQPGEEFASQAQLGRQAETKAVGEKLLKQTGDESGIPARKGYNPKTREAELERLKKKAELAEIQRGLLNPTGDEPSIRRGIHGNEGMFIGFKAIARKIGELGDKAKKYNISGVPILEIYGKYKNAEDMAASGKHTKEEIFDATGWQLTDEGKLKWEMSDKDMKIYASRSPEVTREGKKFGGQIPAKIGDFVRYRKLFDLYPGLQERPAYANPFLKAEEAGFEPDAKSFDFAPRHKTTQAALNNAVPHEIQHYVQGEEGFAKGTSLDLEMRTIGRTNRETYLHLARVVRDSENAFIELTRKANISGADKDIKQARIAEEKHLRLSKQLEDYDIRLRKHAFRIYENSLGEQEARATSARLRMTRKEREAAPFEPKPFALVTTKTPKERAKIMDANKRELNRRLPLSDEQQSSFLVRAENPPEKTRPEDFDSSEKKKYWEDMSEKEKNKFRKEYEEGLKSLEKATFPFKAKFAGEEVEVLGAADDFEPYKSAAKGSRDIKQLMIKFPSGSRAITFGTELEVEGKRLMPKPPPLREKYGFEKVIHENIKKASGLSGNKGEANLPIYDKENKRYQKYNYVNGGFFPVPIGKNHSEAVPSGAKFDDMVRLFIDQKEKVFGTRGWGDSYEQGWSKELSYDKQFEAAQDFFKQHPDWKWLPDVDSWIDRNEVLNISGNRNERFMRNNLVDVFKDSIKELRKAVAEIDRPRTLAGKPIPYKKILQYIEKGQKSEEWYRDFAKMLVDTYGKNYDRAIKTFAIASATTDVSQHFQYTTQAINQMESGVPISKIWVTRFPGRFGGKVQSALARKDMPKIGKEKVAAFWDTIKQYADEYQTGKIAKPTMTVLDMWMARIFGVKPNKAGEYKFTAAQYRFYDKVMKAVASSMGQDFWKSQAMAWTGIQESLGIKVKSPQEIIKPFEMTVSHEYVNDEMVGMDFEDRHLWNTLAHELLTDKAGRQIGIKALGIPQGESSTVLGIEKNMLNPAAQSILYKSYMKLPTKSDVKVLNKAAAVVGLITRQRSVATFVDGNKDSVPTLKIKFGRPVSLKEAQDLNVVLRDAGFDGGTMMPHEEGIIISDFGGKTSKFLNPRAKIAFLRRTVGNAILEHAKSKNLTVDIKGAYNGGTLVGHSEDVAKATEIFRGILTKRASDRDGIDRVWRLQAICDRARRAFIESPKDKEKLALTFKALKTEVDAIDAEIMLEPRATTELSRGRGSSIDTGKSNSKQER